MKNDAISRGGEFKEKLQLRPLKSNDPELKKMTFPVSL